MIDKIHHIAIAVKDIETSAAFYRDRLGLTLRDIQNLSDEGVKIAFIPVGETMIELVEPTSPDHSVSKFIQTRGEGMHHICFEVGDIRDEMRILKDSGVPFTSEEPRPGADGLISFMHPKATGGVLLELVQREGD
jgi:methylmalonyl-CoA epimerase